MKDEISITLKPVETRKASEEIYDQIRGLIVSGEILPGQRLPSERRMMAQMQRSRATIREALRLLERDGYIRTQPGSSGAIVQEPNVDNAVQSLESIMEIQDLTVDNILEFRLMTESTAAILASVRAEDEDIARMRRIIRQARTAVGDNQRFIELDLEFHNALAEATHNVMYVIMLHVCRKMIGESLGDLLETGTEDEMKDRYERILRAHRAICDAISEGDSTTAETEMMTHLTEAEEDLTEHIKKQKND